MENDYDLTPNRVLSEEVRKPGQSVETNAIRHSASAPTTGTVSARAALRLGAETLLDTLRGIHRLADPDCQCSLRLFALPISPLPKVPKHRNSSIRFFRVGVTRRAT